MYAAAIVAFALVVRTILGNRWPAFGLTILFGQSLFLIRLLNWWTATANLLPATVFGLLTFAAYLRWRQAWSSRWLIASLACFFISLLDNETAMLMPLYIAAVRLLVLEGELRPAAWLAALRSEWPIWLGFLVLDVGAAINYYSAYYIPLPHASVGQTLQYLAIAVFSTFIPALFGIKNPQASLGRQPLVIIACVILFLALTGYLLYTRPRTWRALTAFLLIAVITMVPVAVNRIPVYGVHFAKELYYEQTLQFMFLILVALALRTDRRRASPKWLAVILTRLRAAPVAAASLASAALAGYGALYVTSVNAMANASWQPHRSRAYVQTFQASVGSVIRRTGREPVLFNVKLPEDIGGTGHVPYDRYQDLFPIVDGRVQFNSVTTPMYVVSHAGVLVPVTFAARDMGTLARVAVIEAHGQAVPAVEQGGDSCVPPGRSSTLMRIPLARPVRLSALPGALPLALRLFLRMPAPRDVKVLVSGQTGLLADGPFPPRFDQGASGQYIPLNLDTEAHAVELELPAGACITSLGIGSFSPAAG
jgi:hypothetical protein